MRVWARTHCRRIRVLVFNATLVFLFTCIFKAVLGLNLAIRCSWSEPQSASSLVFADYTTYRDSPSLAAKNIINLILVLTIWWCPCVESALVLLEEGVCYDQCVLLAKLLALGLLYFVLLRPNLPVTPGISWLPTFAFQSPMMERTSFVWC